MDNVAKLSKLDREFLFTETANELDVPPLLVEKDFWVVWILNIISKQEIGESLYFRGGTSLSKAYGAINRFSEDIDLGVDPARIYPQILNDLEQAPSRAQRSKIIQRLRQATRTFVEGDLIKSINNGIAHVLREDDWQMEIVIQDRLANLKFHYPRSLQDSNYSTSYIPPSVKLEPDGRASINPSVAKEIAPFLTKQFPDQFIEKSCSIMTLSAERTFWEKVALLHRVFIKPEALPARFSRHCYDVLQLANHLDIFEKPRTKELLSKVIEHNKNFYEQTANTYAGALSGSLRLIPSDIQIKNLEADYENTKVMIFQSEPKFSTMISKLHELQEIINDTS